MNSNISRHIFTATKASLIVAAPLLLVLIAAGCASSNQSVTRVTQEKRYIKLEHLQPKHDQHGTNTASTEATCSKCKLVWYPVQTGWPAFTGRSAFNGLAVSHSITEWQRRHYCPQCKSVVTTITNEEGRTEKVEHLCTLCGDSTASCCIANVSPVPRIE